jgi:hypothetical protein
MEARSTPSLAQDDDNSCPASTTAQSTTPGPAASHCTSSPLDGSHSESPAVSAEPTSALQLNAPISLFASAKSFGRSEFSLPRKDMSDASCHPDVGSISGYHYVAKGHFSISQDGKKWAYDRWRKTVPPNSKVDRGKIHVIPLRGDPEYCRLISALGERQIDSDDRNTYHRADMTHISARILTADLSRFPAAVWTAEENTP